MANISSYFGGSGGGYSLVLPAIQFGSSDSQIWTPQYSGCVAFHVIGGGGKGSTSGCGAGGGSGSYARKVLEITTSQCFCVYVGGQSDCSFVCNVTASPSINVIAYGGCCGGWNSQNNNVGGRGGCCPSGGDVNRCGLCGGSGGGSSENYGGGAAVDIWGLQRGCGGGANGSETNAAGGGGIGGQGGDSGSICTQYPAGGGGGGSGGSGSAARCQMSCTIIAYGGERALAVPPGEEKFWSFIPEWGPGGNYQWSCSSCVRAFSHSQPGVGGGGAGTGAGQNKGGGQNGGMFGGGGGGYYGGRGGCGGGGGGHAACCATGLAPGGGGHGVVFVEYLSVST